ncbi:hypothetical protein ACQY0O_003256 [Thecaphora frezii]
MKTCTLVVLAVGASISTLGLAANAASIASLQARDSRMFYNQDGAECTAPASNSQQFEGCESNSGFEYACNFNTDYFRYTCKVAKGSYTPPSSNSGDDWSSPWPPSGLSLYPLSSFEHITRRDVHQWFAWDGSLVHSWLIKSLVRKSCFVDLVCFQLWLPYVCSNVLYK